MGIGYIVRMDTYESIKQSAIASSQELFPLLLIIF